MMKAFGTIVALVALSGSANAQVEGPTGFFTTASLVDECILAGQEETTPRSRDALLQCAAYIQGFLEAFRAAVPDNCLPEAVEVGQVINAFVERGILVRVLEGDAGLEERPALGIARTLYSTWPCEE